MFKTQYFQIQRFCGRAQTNGVTLVRLFIGLWRLDLWITTTRSLGPLLRKFLLVQPFFRCNPSGASRSAHHPAAWLGEPHSPAPLVHRPGFASSGFQQLDAIALSSDVMSGSGLLTPRPPYTRSSSGRGILTLGDDAVILELLRTSYPLER